jgi:hypothetical protein
MLSEDDLSIPKIAISHRLPFESISIFEEKDFMLFLKKLLQRNKLFSKMLHKHPEKGGKKLR